MFADAQAYERFMGRWSRILAPRLVEFTSLPDSGRVLDVGSGTGALAFSIAELKPQCQVVGIDPSKEYVGYAQSRNRFSERATFQTGDAQSLQFPDSTFDNTLSLLVVNFIPDRKRALAELIRVTKPTGRIAAAVWDYGAGMRMLRLFWDAAVAVDPSAGKLDESHMPLCRAGELAEFWKQCGLDQVEERPLDISMRFESFADYWEPFLLGQGPAGAYVRNLDDHRREALRAEVRRRLAVTAEDVPFSLPGRAWAVRGAVRRR
jgi:SAM-dependent methyltransferase